jgi:hypothetical protein
LLGSSACAVVAPFVSLLYAHGHLETLVHTAVILASVGLIGFGLVGITLGTCLLGRYPMALVLALGTVVAGAWLILRIRADAAVTCSAAPCFRGFEPWIQALLAFNVAFLALLFLVQAWQESRSSGRHGQKAGPWDWLVGPPGPGGRRGSCEVPSPGADARSHAHHPGVSIREYRDLEAGDRSPSFEICKLYGWPQTFVGA